MAGQLTTEQVLLLNNLMYMNGKVAVDISDCEGKTLGEVFNSIDTSTLEDGKIYTDFTTGQEWKDIIEAVKSDPQLCNVRIAESYDDGSGGKAVLFENPADREAIVVYKGTGSGTEWKDNFKGGAGTDMEDGVSTSQQQKALDWYQSLDKDKYDSVTVSGHSKGGNKAKYVTVMDDSVDRCLSFDGQGFSDEFVDKYAEQIAERQYKIENHNIDKDPVNILLNDLGTTTYYKGDNYSSKSLFEHHTPNAFMHFSDDGTFQMIPGEQSQDLQNIDEFFNSYLRSLSDTEKKGTMELLGTLFEMGLGGNYGDDTTALINDMLDTLAKGDNVDYTAKLLAYFLRYEQENPEVAQTIRSLMKDMGFGEFVDTADTILDIVNSDKFNKYAVKLLGGADWIIDRVPDWILKKLCEWIKEEYGVDLTPSQMRKLLGVIESLKNEIPKVRIQDNGADKRVPDAVGSANGNFTVDTVALKRIVQDFEIFAQELSEISLEIGNVYRALDVSLILVKPSLKIQQQNVNRRRNNCQKMKSALEEIIQCYEDTEKKVITYI